LPTVNPEPLILRALPGECVQVTLTNWIKAGGYADMDGYASVPMVVDGFNQNDVDPSMSVSLHANLLAYDILYSDGTNVGLNRTTTAGYTQTVAPSQSITYHWYTGRLTRTGTWEPIEHGIVPLTSSDPIKHSNKGAVGALIVEPANSTWLDSTPIFSYTYGGTLNTRAQTVVTIGAGTDRIQQFHEAVAIYQDDINLRFRNGEPVPNLAISDDPTETGQDGFNYRSEPIWFRAGWTPDTPLQYTRTFPNFDQVLLDSFVGGRPQTPIFDVKASIQARMRMTHPAGDTQNQVFEVTGHNWETEACTANSTVLGWNPLSPWTGSTPMVGPGTKADLLLWQPGGAFAAGGEHLYRTYVAWGFDGGLWGLFRVSP
jgi:manganese oxidase